jgi:general stress protein YciG
MVERSKTSLGRPRGFAAMSREQRSAIARMGGKATQASGNGHRWTSEEASAAGKKGLHRVKFQWPTDGSVADRFWSLVEKTETCWLWRGPRMGRGYGRCGVWGLPAQAYRAAFLLTYGEIAPGAFICHHCDNPPCVRPDHLFAGTHKDNMDDCRRKGRFYKGPTWNAKGSTPAAVED